MHTVWALGYLVVNYFFMAMFSIGLSDDARNDFTLMKDVAVHTRIAPAGREKTLTDFVQQIDR